jgi:hypothetical protein
MPVLNRTLLAALAVALVALLLPAGAASGGKTYKTKIVVSTDPPTLHGKLVSGYGPCIADRTVKLFREQSGPDELIGVDARTGFLYGKWSIPLGKAPTPGTYYAKATVQGDCLPGRSKRITVG